jgi:UDP-GlcNAc:undecaprenyl-phosphate/decaprenyl-phosphate GlcNAc-1-phosphate transferase
MFYFLVFMLSFGLAIIFTIFFRKIAIKYKVYDEPKTVIKTHKEPVPYLGGLAIAGAFFLTLIILRFGTHFETGTLRNLWGIFLSSFLMLILGLIDDLKDLNFKKKFFWQFIAATILISFDMKIKFISPGYLSIIFTYLWVIGIMNAVNLIDIMDGLSSGIAIIAGLAFFFINSPLEAHFVNFAAIALCGACLGFLKFNFNPAKIFMGDAGSLFIGTILSAISLGANYSGNNGIAVFSPILILIIPIYDTLYISYKRMQRGRSIFMGSKDHVALRLKINGWSVKKTVFVLYVFAIFFSFLAFLIVKSNFEIATGIYIFTLVMALFIGKKLSKIKITD